ncbi:MAG TPA: prephenate dehydrogenase [Bacillota bacterium]|nr:prephenate dehydrogenase [Bacillota bacterium]
MVIGIVGLGLIGGSLAKAVKARTGHTVYAYDTDNETMLLARMWNAYDAVLTKDNTGECDMIFVALRPQYAVDYVAENAEYIAKGAILTDLCGVKRAVYAPFHKYADKYKFTYIGAHPMAGKERQGFGNAVESLFDSASVILTPDGTATPEALERLDRFFTDIGFARMVYSDPEKHDKMIAFTSQMPHIISSSYIKSPRAQEHRGYSAGSFCDMSRVAFLDENMWTELFVDNADNLEEELSLMIDNLEKFREALTSRDAAALCALLREGREKKITAGGS